MFDKFDLLRVKHYLSFYDNIFSATSPGPDRTWSVKDLRLSEPYSPYRAAGFTNIIPLGRQRAEINAFR